MGKKLTTEEFIKKSKLIHKDKYDYSKVEYVNSSTEVCIICPEHGEFWQMPSEHLRGHGCRLCGNKRIRIKKQMTTDEFIRKCTITFNGKYDYTNTRYKNYNTEVTITCPIHGEFNIVAGYHLSGQGCPKCSKKYFNLDIFIKKAKELYGGQYDYSNTVYDSKIKKVNISCPLHGEFLIKPSHFLSLQSSCPECKKIADNHNRKENFIKKASLLFEGKYDYKNVNYINNRTDVKIICPTHGEFTLTPFSHLQGNGCPECGKIQKSDKFRKSLSAFIKEANIIHNNKYIYDETEYINNKTKITVKCPIHGNFTVNPNDHLSKRSGCPICGRHLSRNECEIYEYIRKFSKDALQRDHKIIKPKELDIFIPSKNIAIEYDGLHWHNEIMDRITPSFHLYKTELCNEKGVRLIHIFEDEWLEKPQIVKSILKNILGATANYIYARQCEVRNVDSMTATQFLDDNHIQGQCKSKYYYGLYYKGELVSLMTFSKAKLHRKNNEDSENTWELLRFCNKLDTIVVGGASKLLKHFIGEVKPIKIVTYVDKRWSVGTLFKRLGFVHTHDDKPNYFYVVGDSRENRFKYRKSELIKQGFDKNKSEHEIMLERGIPRIYDCGTMAFEMMID